MLRHNLRTVAFGGPDEELWLLMEAAESPLSLYEWNDYQYHAARPGNSPSLDFVLSLERAGYVRIIKARDDAEHRDLAAAEITSEGRRRMDALIREGVRPANIDLSPEL